MERTKSSNNNMLLGLMIIVFVLMVAQNVSAQSLYACWGGCYNQCFLLDRQQPLAARYPCYFACLTGCLIPSTTADDQSQYYCQVGCSAQLCIPNSPDGEGMEKCLGKCGNVCRV